MSALVPSEASEIAQDLFSAADYEALEGLTVKQRAFVVEYPRDFNGTRAAERAGYQGNDESLAVTGARLLRHRQVNPLIRKLTAATADEMGITRESLIARIDEVASRAMAGAPKVHVTKDGDMFEVKDDEGNTITEWQPAAVTRALETLAKLRGDMIERVDVTQRTVEIRINGADLKDLT